MKKVCAWILAVLVVCSVVAVAGDNAGAASNVPKLIRISKYDVKIGKTLEYESLVRQVRQALNSNNANYHWVAASPIAGTGGTIDIIGFYDNFAEIEQSMKSFMQGARSVMQNTAFNRDASESIQGTKGIIARYREDLSYRPEKLDLANSTSWELTVVKLRPGTAMEYNDLEKEAIELHKRGNIDEHWVVYAVEYGGHSPTLLYLTSLKSLADLDVDRRDVHKAVFTDSIRRRFSHVAQEAVVSEESTVLTVRPDLSRAPQTLVAANPGFWTVKEEAPVVASKKGKKSAVQPASMKEKQ